MNPYKKGLIGTAIVCGAYLGYQYYTLSRVDKEILEPPKMTQEQIHPREYIDPVIPAILKDPAYSIIKKMSMQRIKQC